MDNGGVKLSEHISMKSREMKLPLTFFTLMLLLAATLAVSALSSEVNAQTTGSVVINNGADYTNSTAVTLTLSASNAVQMRFSNDNATWSDYEAYATSKNWTLPVGDNNDTVYVQFQDAALQTVAASSHILLDMTPPEVTPFSDYISADFKTMYFDASASIDNVGVKSYIWDFGDGNKTSGIALTHTYAPGNYTVTLTVQDLAGNAVSAPFHVIIPDLSSLPTRTPGPAATATPNPTVNPTAIPPTATASPTSTPTGIDSNWSIILAATVVVIVVVGIAVALVMRNRSKPAVPPS